jgi:hypothetical protein
MKKLMRSKWFMMIVGVLVGTMFGDKIKPMLGGLPVIGPMINKVGGATASINEDEEED